MFVRLGLWVVGVHALVVAGHGFAHSELGVGLSPLQNAFVVPVIVIAPLVAAALLWMRRARAGLVLLTASMFGALAFGFYHHYMLISPDHVSHLPAGELQGLFRITAALLVVSEAIGCGVGAWGLRRAAVPG